MTDTANDTQAGATGTPDGADASASASQGSQGSDQVSYWQGRFNGQTAKVGELTGQIKAKDSRISELEAALNDALTGKVSAEDAAKTLVAKMQKELEQERTGRRTDTLKTRFPEAFGELGDDIASVMDESKLAAIEARLKGGAPVEDDEPPTPLRHNETRNGATRGGQAQEESAADVKARLISSPMPW